MEGGGGYAGGGSLPAPLFYCKTHTGLEASILCHSSAAFYITVGCLQHWHCVWPWDARASI